MDATRMLKMAALGLSRQYQWQSVKDEVKHDEEQKGQFWPNGPTESVHEIQRKPCPQPTLRSIIV